MSLGVSYEESSSQSTSSAPGDGNNELFETSRWGSRDTLLLFSIVHIVGGEGEIDWELVNNKLLRSVMKDQWTSTPTECKERYLQILRITESRLNGSHSEFVKREIVIKCIARGLLNASKSQETKLKEEIADVAHEIVRIDVNETAPAPAEQIPDDECSDADTEPCTELCDESCIESCTEQSRTAREYFCNQYAACFVVENEVYKTSPSLNVDEYVKTLNASYPAADKAISSADMTEINMNEPNSSTCVSDSSEFTTPSFSTRNDPDVDVSRPITTTIAPTLSKLLELPPRERNQPLPQINTLMNENDEPNSTDILNSSISPKPDSPTKLLAALGTTTTPVKIAQSPIIDGANLPGFILKMSSPLKVMDEIEIANDYVMESGLICDSADSTKVPSSDSIATESFIVPPAIQIPKIEAEGTPTESNCDGVNSGLEITSEATYTDQITSQDIAGAVEEKTEALYISPRHEVVASEMSSFEKPVNSELPREESFSKGDENTETIEVSPGGRSADKTIIPIDSNITVKKSIEIVNTPSGDAIESSPERKQRGKRDTPDLQSTPVTRHSAKEKWKSADSEEKLTKESSTPASFRRGASKSGQSDDSRQDEVPSPMGKSTQKRLFTARPTTSDVHAPNLRSRRIPTPTLVATPSEEDSRNVTKHTKLQDEKDVKEIGKIESNSHEVDLDGTSQSNDTSGKKIIASGREEEMVADRREEGVASKSLEIGDVPKRHFVTDSDSEFPTIPFVQASSKEDDNSQLHTKKRLTRRSVKIVSGVLNSKDNSVDDGCNKDESLNKETRTRNHKIMSRLKSTGDESGEKEELLDGKRLTRARAKTSVSPSRTSYKSTGSSKTPVKSDGDTETSESEPIVSRATRSRLGGWTSFAVESLSVNLESNPESSTTVNNKDDEVKDLKSWKKSMLALINRIGQNSHASIFNIPVANDEIAAYKKKIKRPVDLSTIKKNIECGVIKTWAQLERDLNLMFMNLVMFNHLPGLTDATVAGMNSEVAGYCHELFEEFRTAHKVSNVAPEGTKKDDSDIESELSEELQNKTTVAEKPSGRKRRTRSISAANSEEAQETKRRTLRTSTAAATTATSAWQSARQKKIPSSSPDIASLGRGRHE